MGHYWTEDLKETFYIKLYFNIDSGFEDAGLKRAYLDFNRTLRKNNQVDWDTQRLSAQNFLRKCLLQLISKEITSQESFDKSHKEICNFLIEHWKVLTVGQAQKWINMTLKYWLLFGVNRIENIEKNSKYFHIPIDSYVQKGLFRQQNPDPWSKIDNYETYYNYQLKHRELNSGNPPLYDEIVFFNNYNP